MHGWGGSPNEAIHKWLKTALENEGFEVFAPEMPNTNYPKIAEWVNYLDRVVGKIDENTFFVGHSIGCQTIMRFLEKQNKKIGGVVFVAGWFNLANMESKEEKSIAGPWIKNDINFDNITKIADKIIVFISSNEPYGYVEENVKIFEEKLHAKVIIENNKGHFTEGDGVTEVPEVVEAILEMQNDKFE